MSPIFFGARPSLPIVEAGVSEWSNETGLGDFSKKPVGLVPA